MNQELQIRNSTSDFLIFTKQHSEDGINVRIEDETIWLTQEGIATLFDKGRTTIVEHIKNIYSTGELSQEATCRKIRQVRMEGVREVIREQPFYNLDMVISVGYRVDSIRATQFRQWATTQTYAESEFEKYRVIQDAIYTSDFDLFAQAIEQTKRN